MVSYALAEAVSANAVMLYIKLSRYADNSTGVAWPSRATLAAELGFKQARAVDPYVAELVAAGAITVTRRTKPGSKENEKNLYTVKRAHEITPVKSAPGGSAAERTTPPEEVVRSNAPRSAAERTTVVRSNAQELITNELITNELITTQAEAPPGPLQEALIPAPARPKKTPNPARPEWEVAAWVSDQTSGAWTKHMLAPRVRWMLNERGLSRRDAALLLVGMYRQSGAAPTQGNIGRVIDGHRKLDGRGPEIDRTAEKMHNTLTMKLPGTPAAGGQQAITSSDPFLDALRITS
jgi:hypothetical protein